MLVADGPNICLLQQKAQAKLVKREICAGNSEMNDIMHI